MQDGLNCKIVGDIINKYFKFDKNGMLGPDPALLNMGLVKEKFERQLNGDTGFLRRLSEIYMRADVDMANRPLGSTPVISAGVPLFGVSPIKKLKYQTKVGIIGNAMAEKVLDKRERRVKNYILELKHLSENVHTDNDPARELVLSVEKDQLLTGGGYDNTIIGDVTKSGLNFVNRGWKTWNIWDTAYSDMIVTGAKMLEKHLKDQGFREGEFIPYGAHLVRFMQDTDGMLGYPVLAKANSPLTKDIALRLLLDTGIDVRGFVGTHVVDKYHEGADTKYRVVDAIAYILDHLVVSPDEMPSLIILLVRIQRHGYKIKDDELLSKDGKCRSIYPNAAIPALIEAMTFAPFLQALKDRKIDFMPSLQDRPTRQDMLKDMLVNVWGSKDYVGLAADWSKYDATVKGCILATIIYYAVRPFFNVAWQNWVDASMYILIYKYVIVSDPLAKINNDMYSEALQVAPNFTSHDWTVFGTINGLISGAKFTHVGGSMYGEVVIHYAIPTVLGFEPVWGPQAGDDTDLGVPRSRVDTTDVVKTYTPIADAAAIFDLDMNVSKQIWHSYAGEVVQVFLQDVYQPNLNIFGMGSAFRYVAGAPFAERDSGLSIAEQELAIISKLNNGWDNYFVNDTVEFWLQKDKFMAALFKQYGTSAMNKIIQSIGVDPKVLRQRLGLGDYEWGFSAEAFDTGTLPIVDTIAQVASNMSVNMTAEQALSRMGLASDNEVNIDGGTLPEEDDEASD